MRAGIIFSFISGVLAAGYFWLAYTSGSEKTRDGDVLAGAVLYGPLVAASVASLLWKADVSTAARPWVLLLVLCVSSAFMAALGYNMAGAIVGLVNMVLCWVLAVRAIKAASVAKQNDV